MSLITLTFLGVLAYAAALMWFVRRARASRAAETGEHVIGHEMRAAARAEQRRLAYSPPRRSPLPAQRYGDLPHGSSILFVEEMSLDREIRDVVDAFAEEVPANRLEITEAVDMAGLYELLQFAKRAAVFALRQRSRERCLEGFRALAMVDLARVDTWDVLWALAMLDHVITRTWLDRQEIYDLIIEIASAEMAVLLDVFSTQPHGERALDSWGLREVVTPRGHAFALHNLASYRPSAELLDCGVRMCLHLDSTRFVTEDPEIGTELPAVWLKSTARKEAEAILERCSGVVTIRAARLPDRHFEDAEEVLRVFLLELPLAAEAEQLAGATRGIGWRGSVLGVVEGNLLAVIVNQASASLTPPKETPETMEQLAAELRVFLKGTAARETAAEYRLAEPLTRRG